MKDDMTMTGALKELLQLFMKLTPYQKMCSKCSPSSSKEECSSENEAAPLEFKI